MAIHSFTMPQSRKPYVVFKYLRLLNLNKLQVCTMFLPLMNHLQYYCYVKMQCNTLQNFLYSVFEYNSCYYSVSILVVFSCVKEIHMDQGVTDYRADQLFLVSNPASSHSFYTHRRYITLKYTLEFCTMKYFKCDTTNCYIKK